LERLMAATSDGIWQVFNGEPRMTAGHHQLEELEWLFVLFPVFDVVWLNRVVS
jgi:hypothetical protein